ncbi:MAG: hypothetical protein AB1352_05830 [Patescibacteria group bacterium]
MRYAFFLGHTPALSLAELFAVAARVGVNLKILRWSRAVALGEIASRVNIESLFRTLAGLVKIAAITKTVHGALTPEHLRSLLPTTGRKLFFGLSAYTLEPGAREVDCRRLGLSVKRLLQEEQRSARLVTSREGTLSSVVINTNKLLSERGAEIVILSLRNGAYLGRTLAVQLYKEFARRDMGRPARDARVGMLPPKIARMMVNLACVHPGETLLDPFCGSGTILQEALLLGIDRLWGSDYDKRAIDRTRANLEWLSAFTPQMKTASFLMKLIRCSIEEIPARLPPGSVEAIVTEPYLGPPRVRPLSPAEVAQMRKELTFLYRRAFVSCAHVLVPGGRVVMAWPVWRVIGRKVSKSAGAYLDLERTAEEAGLAVVDPYLTHVHPLPGAEHGYLKERRSLLYQREDQVVMREIRIFEKSQ